MGPTDTVLDNTTALDLTVQAADSATVPGRHVAQVDTVQASRTGPDPRAADSRMGPVPMGLAGQWATAAGTSAPTASQNKSRQ